MLADARVFRRLGAYPLCAVTAITPQNSSGVKSVHPTPPDILKNQLDCLFEDFEIAVVKTGQIPDADTAEVIYQCLHDRSVKLIVDPVISPTKGVQLIDDKALDIIRTELIGIASLITPNVHEAELLWQNNITSNIDIENACAYLASNKAESVIITGGDTSGSKADDYFHDGSSGCWLRSKKLPAGDIHGTGCHFSSAAAVCMANGDTAKTASTKAKKIMQELISENLITPNIVPDCKSMKLIFS